MNLLLFVFTFLLVIASISYQGLAHYKSNALIRIVWDRLIRVEEPCLFNKLVKDSYIDMKSSKTNAPKDPKPSKEESAEGSSSINFRFFVDSAFANANPKQTEQIEIVLKKLIYLLYSDQPFFQLALQARPSIIQDILNALKATSDELGSEKISTKKKLQNLSLKDSELESLWYQLRRDNPMSLHVLESIYNFTPEELQQSQDEVCFQTNLIEYLNNTKAQKIRLYLASRPLLFALLEDSNYVNEVIQKRKDLYNEVRKKNNPLSLEEASLEFQNFASKFPLLSQFEAIISYSITKTNPSDYE